MFHSDRDIFIQETEIRPNRYASLVLLVTLIGTILCWILNEIGIFHVGLVEMRIGSLVTSIVVAVPLLLCLAKKELLRNPKTKYVIISCSIVYTLSTSTLMTFHTTIMLLLPIFLAMLYRSKKLGYLAAAGSFVCTFLSSVLGYILGTWDIPLFQELIAIGTNGVVEITGASPGISLLSIGKIILFLVLPKTVMIGSSSLLLFHVIQLGLDNVQQQVLLNRFSYRDILTGLYNQNAYKEFIAKASDKDMQISVLFFDVNGLKAVNDKYGHEYGDLLLKRCAKSISAVCDEETEAAFRIGGDEFIMVLPESGEPAVKDRLEKWQAALKAVNQEKQEEPEIQDKISGCSMAVGYATGKLSEITDLVRYADEQMYRNKTAIKGSRSES